MIYVIIVRTVSPLTSDKVRAESESIPGGCAFVSVIKW